MYCIRSLKHNHFARIEILHGRCIKNTGVLFEADRHFPVYVRINTESLLDLLPILWTINIISRAIVFSQILMKNVTLTHVLVELLRVDISAGILPFLNLKDQLFLVI